ncbi:hypothetical protein EVAR_47065_1 [Eumeta japonica]|uniref:Uncharacterized protein n=1 Tax=Eumeta variegata TaxID=151549 RepID=A0A4C1WKC8_EUMVA|nr:hypothetical protein EVAR_47065_1 [Eumeta japonica]
MVHLAVFFSSTPGACSEDVVSIQTATTRRGFLVAWFLAIGFQNNCGASTSTSGCACGACDKLCALSRLRAGMYGSIRFIRLVCLFDPRTKNEASLPLSQKLPPSMLTTGDLSNVFLT